MLQVHGFNLGDLCKTALFSRFLRQAQIQILKILNIFLWLKFSSFLALNKMEHFSRVSSCYDFVRVLILRISKTQERIRLKGIAHNLSPILATSDPL